MSRNLQPELLDLLPAQDPRALGSRRDLVRLNGLMRHPQILSDLLAQQLERRSRLRIVELGAGDGKLLLDIAQRLGRRTPAQSIEAVLVDRQNVIAPNLHEQFQSLNWSLRTVTVDVFEFFKSDSTADVFLANLFLHHFTNAQLKEIFTLIARRTNTFIALEPRRAPLPLFLCGLIRFIGCNAVTRHDARVSVEAGFNHQELSPLWPKSRDWQLTECKAGLFSHLFIAERKH